jgi:hypothetical protein
MFVRTIVVRLRSGRGGRDRDGGGCGVAVKTAARIENRTGEAPVARRVVVVAHDDPKTLPRGGDSRRVVIRGFRAAFDQAHGVENG